MKGFEIRLFIDEKGEIQFATQFREFYNGFACTFIFIDDNYIPRRSDREPIQVA